jgi:hypothetical protein
VVSVIARANVATSAAAMGESITKAAELLTVLENTAWEVFEKIERLPKARSPQAQVILESVKDALTRDEHVIQLRGALKEAQSAALDLLTSLIDSIPPPTPPTPVMPPPSPTVTATDSQRGIDVQRATTLFETITREMQSDADLVLDIQWRLYRKGSQSR